MADIAMEPFVKDPPPQEPSFVNIQENISEDLGIIPGKRGSLEELLGEYFTDRKRTAGTRFARGALYVAGSVFFPVGLGLLTQSVVVPNGSIGISLNDGVPEILSPGRHCLVSPFNRRGNFKTFSLTEKEIVCQNISILKVADDEFALAEDQGKPLILGSGIHVIDNPFFHLIKRVPQSQPVISNGTLHRVIIEEGRRGVAMDGNVPIFLKPGIYTKKSPLFKFQRSVPVDEQLVELSPYMLVTPFDGEVGICFKSGMLECLPPGVHWLYAEKNEEFLGFLPTTEQVREMKTLDILTSDGLMVRIKGSISFRVSDPERAIKHIGESVEGLQKVREKEQTIHHDIKAVLFSTILKRANDTLAGLLTGSDLLTTGGLGFATASAVIKPQKHGYDVEADMREMDKGKAEDAVYEPREKKKMELSKLISAEFADRLTNHIREEWGIELSNMAVTDIQVLDEDVKKALAEGVRSNIEATTARRNAQAEAETARILASGEADSTKIKADGQAYTIREVAKAQVEAGKLLEQTPTAVKIRLAEAGANAINSSSLVLAPDVGTQSLLGMIGAAKSIMQPGESKAQNSVTEEVQEE